MQIKLLTGMRRGDLLRLTMSNLQEGGIHITPGKSEDSTGERLIYSCECASDAETLEHAQALLAHADGKVTQRIYRREPERVRPLR
jgi:integrase